MKKKQLKPTRDWKWILWAQKEKKNVRRTESTSPTDYYYCHCYSTTYISVYLCFWFRSTICIFCGRRWFCCCCYSDRREKSVQSGIQNGIAEKHVFFSVSFIYTVSFFKRCLCYTHCVFHNEIRDERTECAMCSTPFFAISIAYYYYYHQNTSKIETILLWHL